MGLNPNCSSRSSPRSFTTCKILARRILPNNTNRVQDTNGPIGRGQCSILPRFKDRDHSSVLPHLRKVMGAENHVEYTGEEGNRSLGKVLQYPVRYTVRARSLGDLETP